MNRTRTRRIIIRGVLAALAALAGACRSVAPPPAEAAGPARMDRYPAAADPVEEKKPPAPPIPPQLIEGAEKSTLIYSCRNVQAEALKDLLENFVSPEGMIQASRAMNILIVSDAKDTMAMLQQTVEALDRPIPQVLVEARVVEVTLDSDLEYEINHLFSHPAGGGTSFGQTIGTKLTTPGSNPNPEMGALINVRPWATDTRQLDNYIRLLITKGKAKILSSPNLIVSAGNEASIITGEEVPIQSATVVSGSVSTTTQFKSVGIKLLVTPLQITHTSALLDVNPEVSTVTGYTAPGTTGVSNPIVAVRNCKTVLELKDGEVLTIGGLLKNEDRSVLRKVPGLGDIPILGHLFRARRDQQVKTQLVFFLRMNILAEGGADAMRLHAPGAGLDLLDKLLESPSGDAAGSRNPPVPNPEKP
ncbi:MAG: secretin N-terminal domain-containing protein [Planctomycetota bacterium]